MVFVSEADTRQADQAEERYSVLLASRQHADAGLDQVELKY